MRRVTVHYLGAEGIEYQLTGDVRKYVLQESADWKAITVFTSDGNATTVPRERVVRIVQDWMAEA